MKLSVRELVIAALMSALFCILGPLSIPIGPIPLSLTGLVLYMSLYITGRKMTAIAYLIYLIIGMIGLPVFSGYAGGLGKVIGPTGGYLAGYIFTALISGTVIDKYYNNRIISIIGMYIGLIFLYAFGTLWYAIINEGNTVLEILKICIIPFIPADSIKIILSAFLGPILKERIKNAQN